MKIRKFFMGFVAVFSILASASDKSVDFGQLRQKVVDFELGAGLSDEVIKNAVDALGVVGSFETPQSCTVKQLEDILKLLKSDGSFSDIDYSSRGRSDWQVINHLLRIKQFLVASSNLKLSHSKKTLVRQKASLALDYWLEKDLKNPNWWYNEIGVPKVLGGIACIYYDSLTAEQMQKTVTILKRARISRTGQNLLWLAANALHLAIITEDEALFAKAANAAKKPIVVTSNEGIQPDWSFHQHGPQLYQGNYGRHFAHSTAFLLYLLNDTKYEFSEKESQTVTNYLLEGTQWMMWGKLLDYNTWGRQVAYSDRFQGPDLVIPLQGMVKAGGELKDKFVAWVARIGRNEAGGQGAPVGNRYFWRSDFMVQRSENFYTSLRMNSKRTLGNEICNSEGLLNYFLADGATMIYVDGQEFDQIFPVWDWHRIPGVTCPQFAKRVTKWLPYRGKTDFVGGVSNGKVGVGSMDYDRFGVKGKKSWFFCGDFFVGLGAGITSDNTEKIHTSVNQTLAKGKISKGQGSKWQWCQHDKISYFFPKGQQFYAQKKSQSGNWKRLKSQCSGENITKDIFSIGIDHGIKPQNSSYSYVVYPKMGAKNAAKIADKNLVKILKNEAKIQAVSYKDAVMISFFQAGTFAGVKVSQPCLVIKQKERAYISDPTQKLTEITISVDGKEQLIELPQGGYAGGSVEVSLNKGVGK